MRTRCEAVRSMIAAGDVQGAMDAVCAVDASILKVSRTATRPDVGHTTTPALGYVHAASQCCRRCIAYAYTALVIPAEADTAHMEP